MKECKVEKISVKKKSKDDIKEQCWSEIRCMSEVLQGGIYQKKFEQIMSESKPIPLNTFKAAIREAYKAEGIPDRNIDYEIEKAITRSQRASEIIFTTDAQNCFSNEAKKQREIENKQNTLAN